MLLLRFFICSCVQRYHTAHSSHQAQCVVMKACATLDARIRPAATKADMKPPPQIPSGPLLPPFDLLHRAWGRKDGRLRGRKTSIRTQRMTGGSPLLLRQPPQAEHGGLCLATELVRASWRKHTHTRAHLTGGHPRELICQGLYPRVCVSRHLTGACVRVSVCAGVQMG